jgi:Zn-dependent peptidase ImmA (M78 family)
MLGEIARFNPEAYLEQNHPDVRVYERPLRGGVQGCIDHEQRIIWLDATLSPAARRCTLAYEIAHLEFGPTPSDPLLASAHQRAATEWAALMLVPTEDFVEAWAGCLDLVAMAAYCAVDVATFRARIRAASDGDQDAAFEAIRRTRLDESV